ncbi:MAG TPA: sugar transferase [Anaerolineae bacterium]|nr:sugar transferase [Anaerolineae bacterium]HRV91618.1 sugar transferase [Anaerolineae bacterium]
MIDEESLKNVNLPHSQPRIFAMQPAEHKSILLTVDGVLVLLALLIGLWFGAQRSNWLFSLDLVLSYSIWFVGITAIYIVLATVNNAYHPKVASDPVASFVAISKTVLQIFAIYLLIYALLPPWSLPRHFIGFFALISPFLLVGWRLLYSWAFKMTVFQQKAIIVGAGWAGKTIAKILNDHAPSQFQLVGFVDDDPTKQHTKVEGALVLGSVDALPGLVQAHGVTDVVLAITRDVPGHALSSLINCYERNVRISTMAELYEWLTDRVPVEHIGDNWFVVLPLSNRNQTLAYRVTKRMMDIVISAVGLLLFAPLFPVLALLIKIDSSGPIFYRQKRVGRGGYVFELIKLRSMVVDAEKDGVAKWADFDDPRVTKVGRFLRQTRLDEVPQLFNVLRGEMSLIGPRPERPEFVQELEQEIPFYRTRLSVKPGLTGWAQVNYDYGRSAVDALEKLRYDLYYIKHQSIHLDVIILLKTIGTVLMLRGT